MHPVQGGGGSLPLLHPFGMHGLASGAGGREPPPTPSGGEGCTGCGGLCPSLASRRDARPGLTGDASLRDARRSVERVASESPIPSNPNPFGRQGMRRLWGPWVEGGIPPLPQCPQLLDGMHPVQERNLPPSCIPECLPKGGKG